MMYSRLALLCALPSLLFVRAEDNGTDENNTEVDLTPTPLPTPTPTPMPTKNETDKTVFTTTFTVSVKLTSLDDFDVEDFMKGMAKAMGVDAKDVEITETFFAMSTTLTFPSAITKAQLADTAAAMALANDVPAEHVNLTFVSRRLRGSETRRLGGHEGSKVEAKILVPTADKAKAALIKDKAVSEDTLAAVAKALGVNASDITAATVEIAVEAKTVAMITGGTALEAPSTQKLLDGLKEVAPNKTFVVQYIGEATVAEKEADAPTDAPTPSPAPTPAQEPANSGASGVATVTAVAATLVALVLA